MVMYFVFYSNSSVAILPFSGAEELLSQLCQLRRGERAFETLHSVVARSLHGSTQRGQTNSWFGLRLRQRQRRGGGGGSGSGSGSGSSSGSSSGSGAPAPAPAAAPASAPAPAAVGSPDPEGCCTLLSADLNRTGCDSSLSPERCAHQQCDDSPTKVKVWKPEDYNHHPYTCCAK